MVLGIASLEGVLATQFNQVEEDSMFRANVNYSWLQSALRRRFTKGTDPYMINCSTEIKNDMQAYIDNKVVDWIIIQSFILKETRNKSGVKLSTCGQF